MNYHVMESLTAQLSECSNVALLEEDDWELIPMTAILLRLVSVKPQETQVGHIDLEQLVSVVELVKTKMAVDIVVLSLVIIVKVAVVQTTY